MSSLFRHYLRRLYRELMPWLYSRRNHRLFLQRSFESLTLRHQATICAGNSLSGFVRPIPIRPPFGRSMVVVAPHHDDEVIGAGGVILLQRKARGEVRVVITQDGGDEHAEDGRTRAAQIRLRETEALAAAEIMDLPEPPTFLRMQTLQGKEQEELADSLEAILLASKADIVLSPFLLDYNHHHQLTNYALAEALSRLHRPPRVWGYEVWGLAIPNIIVNIDEVADIKFSALRAYGSQLAGRDYVQGVTGLNMFHASSLGAGECRFAERFFDIPGSDFVRVVKDIQQATQDGNTSELRVF